MRQGDINTLGRFPNLWVTNLDLLAVEGTLEQSDTGFHLLLKQFLKKNFNVYLFLRQRERERETQHEQGRG